MNSGMLRITKVVSEKFDFVKFHWNKIVNPQYFFGLIEEKMLKIEQQLKFETEDGREAPWYPSIL